LGAITIYDDQRTDELWPQETCERDRPKVADPQRISIRNTGKMMEKYHVEDLNLDAGGGEYPVQDGFGWTNGVYLALKKMPF